MPKPRVHEPLIVAALQASTKRGVGMEVSELAAIAACSRQQVYKVIRKLVADGAVEQMGSSVTGGRLWRWRSDQIEGIAELVLRLGSVLTVTGMAVNEHGHTINFVIEPPTVVE